MKFLSVVAIAHLGHFSATAFSASRNRALYHTSSHLNLADVAASSEEVKRVTSSEEVKRVAKGESIEDLKTIAFGLNPLVPFFDPIGLAKSDFSGQGDEATIGFLRQAEIKHGRVAMAAFVGYVAQANGYLFNFGKDFPNLVGVTPENQWDSISVDFRLYLIAFVGFLEVLGEISNDKTTHYMRGGKPGTHPLFPSSRRKEEDKRVGRLKEINNGRLAMLGIMGFVSESSISGSVPLLKDRITSYDGNIWNPFEGVVFFEAVENASNTVQVASAATSDVSAVMQDIVYNIGNY